MAGTTDEPVSGQECLIKLRKVLDKTSLPKSSMYKLMSGGNFPKSREHWEGSRARVWVESEVDAWIQQQIRRTDDEPDDESDDESDDKL